MEQIIFTVYLGLSLHLMTYISQGSTRRTQPVECICVHIHKCIYLSIYKETDRQTETFISRNWLKQSQSQQHLGGFEINRVGLQAANSVVYGLRDFLFCC